MPQAAAALAVTDHELAELQGWLRPKRRTHDDVRHGTTTLFAASEVATGRVTDSATRATATPSSSPSSSWWPGPIHGGSCTRCWTTTAPHPSQGRGLAQQASAYPPAVHPDLGKLDAPRRALLCDHHAPGDPVWQLRRRFGPDRRFVDGCNERCQPFVWVKDANDIMITATRKRTSGDAVQLLTDQCCLELHPRPSSAAASPSARRR
jgi:hypothetical protein